MKREYFLNENYFDSFWKTQNQVTEEREKQNQTVVKVWQDKRKRWRKKCKHLENSILRMLSEYL